MPLVKLDKPLNRRYFPTLLPNGGGAPILPTSPYAVRTYTNEIGNANNFFADEACGGLYTSPCRMKYYVEVEKIVGTYDINTNLISQPGAYIITAAQANDPRLLFSFPPAYFINDPNFKLAAFGNLPLLAVAGVNSWRANTVAGTALKNDKGQIELDCNQVAGTSSLIWKKAWGAIPSYVDIDVQYLPMGAELNVLGAGGVTDLVISQNGRYRVGQTLGAGEYFTITNNNQVSGKAVINSLMAQAVNTGSVFEGQPYGEWKSTVFFGAQDWYFDKVMYPATQFAASGFGKPNLWGFTPIPGKPLLGYGSMPPPSGVFRVGDTIRNNNAIAGAVSGWRCIAAGNPGTWMPLATL